MEGVPKSASIRRLPQALIATLTVVGAPLAVASILRSSGTVTGFLPLVIVGTALSLAASYLGGAIWATRPGAGDTLFGDLMLWGWSRRWLAERQLASAVKLLGLRESPGDPPPEISADRHVRLLTQLAASLEARCPDTLGHSRRVARHAAAIAKRMGLAPEEVARIRTAAAVHDVGKLYIPGEIIDKPGVLTEAEFAVVKRHVELGARMVRGLDDEELTRVVRHHHERIDGTGYPGGLAGDEIPLGARIVAVADTFDAITSKRPYRSARRHRDALAVLAEEAGTQLDPTAVRAFRGYYSGLRPVALWSLLINGPRQLLASLGNGLRLGNVAVAAQAGAATAVTVAAVAVHASGAEDPGSQRAAARGQSAGAAVGSPAPSGGSSLPVSVESGQGQDRRQAEPTSATAERLPEDSSAGESAPGADSDTGGDGSSPNPGRRTEPGATDGGGARPPVVSTAPDLPSRTAAKVLEPVSSTVDGVEKTAKDTVDATAGEVESALPREVKTTAPAVTGGLLGR